MVTRVVILGGSFAGLTAAYDLKRKLKDRVRVTVVSRTDRFWFIPSLIWVPFGRRTAEDISFPLRPALEAKGIVFRHETATRILPERNVVVTERGELEYDYLLIATGPAYNFKLVKGLGPDGYTQSVCNVHEAEACGKAWQEFLKDPGPIVIGGTQFASCFGAAYEVLFNVEHALRKAGVRERVPSLTYVTSEPFLTHFGIGGMRGGEPMIKAFFRFRHLDAVTDATIREVAKDKVILEDGRELPFRFAIIIPPFLGADVVRESGLGNEKGFVEVDECYRHVRHHNIFAAGVAAVVPSPPGRTKVPVGVPKTGYMSEVMAAYAAKNIIADVTGGRPKRKPFQRITPLCIMDCGDMEVLIAGSSMFPPRALSMLVPNPFGDWAKVLFEKYYLWRMRTGSTWLP